MGDGIRRSCETRLSNPPVYGYSPEALLARRQILQAACNTLVDPDTRGDYNRGLVEDPSSILATDVPWDKVPGALCLLQESGETEVVLDVGNNLLQERLPKPFKRDVVLAMALAYVDLSRDAMALDPPDFIKSREVLERALKLLQEEGASNLATDLQAQIDETLEEITPRSVLELLALPLDEEHKIHRQEGLHGVRNILWTVGGGGAAAIGGGFTREEFMSEAFLRMTSSEQVELFATTPSNIPPESFEVYEVALALVAQAVSTKKPHLVKQADNLFMQLQQTKVVASGVVSDYTTMSNRELDFVLERGLCCLLCGDIEKCRYWLGVDDEESLYRDPSILEFITENSQEDNDNDVLPGLCKLLETWLTNVVFPRFRDTEGVQFKLGDYYDDQIVLRYLESLEGGGSSSLAAAAAIARIGAEASVALGNVKASAMEAFYKVFTLNKKGKVLNKKANDYALDTEDVSLSESNADAFRDSADAGKSNATVSTSGELMSDQVKDAILTITCGGVMVGLLALLGFKYVPVKSSPPIDQRNAGPAMAADVITTDLPADEAIQDVIPRMDATLAEKLVRRWQMIKSEALGPDHSFQKLSEVLDGRMLKIWTDRASDIARNGWFWQYTLLNLTIDSVTVSLDGSRATVEVTLEEAAKFSDTAHPEHNDSVSTSYSTRYEMSYLNSGWKITEGAVLK